MSQLFLALAPTPAESPSPPTQAAVDDGSPVHLPASLSAAVGDARRRHRSLVAAAGRWSLAEGVSLPADHVALWAATAEAAGHPGDVDGTTGPWRASQIPEFLDTVAAWCTLAGCAPPLTFAESLWHLYGFLAATGRLHPASDPLVELRAAIVVFARIDHFRPVPPPPAPTAA